MRRLLMIESVNIKMILSVALISAFAYLTARFILMIISEIVQRTHIVWHKRWLDNIQTLLAPIVLFGAIITMMCYNPIWTLAVCVIIYFLFKDFLRNYYLGLYFKINGHFDDDTNITIDKYSGNIDRFGFLGIWLHTDVGLQFVNYKRIFTSGFTVNDSDHISTSYTIDLAYESELQLKKLRALIISSPYLDSHQKVNITQNEAEVSIKVHLRNSAHYQEIIKLLDENGFTITK